MQKLEATKYQQEHPPSVPKAALKALSPLSAFKAAGDMATEKELKNVFLGTTSRVANELSPLSKEAFELDHRLEQIHTNLDWIKELTMEEMGDLPQMDILAELWTQLARADDYATYQSHKHLLADLTEFYRRANEVMTITVAALNRIDSELDEFRDEYATPGLVLQDYPLEIIISMTRNSIKRLERGRMVMDGIEGGE